MDLNLSQEKFSFAKTALSTSLTQEETMEMIVPDALPDILRIVDTDANVFLRSKDTDNGRVSVSGTAVITVVYCPEGVTGVRRMEFEMPFTVVATGADITPNSKVTANLSAASVDASVINPRKLVARADILSDIACYNETEMSVSTGTEEGGEAGIEILPDRLEVFTPTSVKEKTFVIADELALPASSPPIGEILKTTVFIDADDTKAVGNKLIVRGNTHVAMLYSPEGGGDICSAEFDPEFSQMLELENVSGDAGFDIMAMPTSAYFDAEPAGQNSDGRTVSTEIHVVAQCVASENLDVAYISDTYSTKFKLDQQSEQAAFDVCGGKTKTNVMYHGTIETQSQVNRVVAVSVHPGAVTQSRENDTIKLKCPVMAEVIYTADDGRVMSVSKRFDVESSIDVKGDCNYSARASCGREVYGVPAGNNIELRFPVDFIITECCQRHISAITEISYDESSPIDMSSAPSIVLYRASDDDTFWNLAKKHNSTQRLIMSANGIDEDAGIEQGQLLIIPKKR